MSKYSVQAIILAAGKSKRFNTGTSKLLEKLCGQEMILYPTKLLKKLNMPVSLVIGHQAEEITKCVEEHIHTPVSFVEQKEQYGTGHALAQSQATWNHDHILVMNGDMPLVSEDNIKNLLEKHYASDAAVTFVTAHLPEAAATHYGRVIQEGKTVKIIEAKDITQEHQDSCCINAGMYIFNTKFLNQALDLLENNNNAQEFYITDLINIANDQQQTIETVSVPFDNVRGINTLKELWMAEHIKRSELISYWMQRGVRFDVAQSVHLDVDITIEAGTKIGAGVHLFNGTKIGYNVTIEPFCIIKNSHIGDNTTIYSHSVISDALIEPQCAVGPFAHIRNQSVLKQGAVIGNFVETTRTTLQAGAKAKHLAYLGDAHVGSKSNIGAGTITCNYDGLQKHKTIIEENVFIGSNNTLVAPLTIKKDSYTAAGSTITQDVPAQALAIGRARQINKEAYAKKIAAKKNNRSEKKEVNEHSFLGAIKTSNDSLENS
ncbi:MAG: bifunctional UDP-N-acetylglucosamine diphosphorylase/glucosamine-1-phosphate N-acetyltransferase GlmU [Candidatus Babeliales bacterium]